MKVQYDVKVPRNTYGNSPYADAFWNFYESKHKNVRFEYDTVEEATSAQKRMCMLTSRNKIYDVMITRRKNVLYVIKSGEEEARVE